MSKKIFVCLCLIVRDEGHCITQCLDSFSGSLDAVAIVDTGSNDNTISVIQNYLKVNKIFGGVISKPWGYFAISRNDSIEYAHGIIRSYNKINQNGPLTTNEYNILSKSNWKLLITDADNKFLHNDDECKSKEDALYGKYNAVNIKECIKKAGYADDYNVRMKSGDSTMYTHKGIVSINPSGANGSFYRCPIHEYIATTSFHPVIKTIENIYSYSGRHGG